MRACTKCGEVKPLDAFPPVRRGESKLQTWCRDCFAAYGREYYRKNREGQKARLLRNTAARRSDNQRRMIEYLLAHPCVDCGEGTSSSFSSTISETRSATSPACSVAVGAGPRSKWRSRSVKFGVQIATGLEPRFDTGSANLRESGRWCHQSSYGSAMGYLESAAFASKLSRSPSSHFGRVPKGRDTGFALPVSAARRNPGT